eukprot:NODE_1192_length_1652_cov_29.522770_g1058_i0.p1 GENE.NODE_1192_length_1652_cov_29.522770_g1058_i0~~NODE_1192_length_1652_cov_29.522770_g1058_i0.p1  ORF type:complete len:435 (-),score=63.85 NODE_1192_length_1652_cov_29.522770_g1058_i0:116-1420(-)
MELLRILVAVLSFYVVADIFLHSQHHLRFRVKTSLPEPEIPTLAVLRSSYEGGLVERTAQQGRQVGVPNPHSGRVSQDDAERKLRGPMRPERRAVDHPVLPLRFEQTADASTRAAMLQRYAGMSIVFTWVNTSDPMDAADRRSLGRFSYEACREDEQLRYSFRAMDKFMEWHTGTVYLVTPGYWPHWINRSHPRLKLVSQYEIMDPACRPCLNSNALEQRFHLLPGISETFVHMNDDYMFLKPVRPWHLVTPEGAVQLFMGPGRVSWSTQSLGAELEKKIWRAMTAHSWDVAEGHFNVELQHYTLKHSPFVYSRKAMVAMHRVWPQELHATALHPHRHYQDVITPILHHSLLLLNGSRLGVAGVLPHPHDLKAEHAYIGLKDTVDTIKTRMDRLKDAVPRFLTVNGGCKDRRSADFFIDWLASTYPTASQFESA